MQLVRHNDVGHGKPARNENLTAGESMYTQEDGTVNSRSRKKRTALLLAVVGAAFAMLQGCSGGTNFSSSSTSNPAPGVNLVGIKITPSTSLLALGSSRQLFATGVYSDGSTANLTSQVTWGASPAECVSSLQPPCPPLTVSVSSGGMATGMVLGLSAATATLSGVEGLLQLTVNTDGYTSNTLALMTVPYKNTEVDVVYQPHSLTQTQGVYTVEEVNLDADQFTSQLPVAAAVMASIPLPSGYVPNATFANGADGLVAVISYSSPQVLIIDASNLSSDATNNTVIDTFTAPVSGQVTFNGNKCTICAGVVNPLNGQLLLSTAQGYYSMDFTTGQFTQLAFQSTVFPAPGFALNPVASPPYIISATFGQDPQNPSEVQIANLPSSSGPGAVNTYTTFGLTQPNTLTYPNAVVVGLVANEAGSNDVEVVDAGANDRALINLVGTQVSASTYLVGPMDGCMGTTGPFFNMTALGTAPVPELSDAQSTPFFSQTSGNCVGFEVWPLYAASSPFEPSSGDVQYLYGPMPNTPDSNSFTNGSDPNAIATFTSVIDGNNYGVLVDQSQNWIAKVCLTGSKGVLENEVTDTSIANPPPKGQLLPTSGSGQNILSAGNAADSVVFLPAPDSVAILSQNAINFGSLSVGTTTPQSLVTLTNVGQNLLTINGVSITGTNADQFAYTTTCFLTLNPASNCAIEVSFTPTSAGQFTAQLNVSDNGGQSPQSVQTVQLCGAGSPQTVESCVNAAQN